MKTVYTGGVWDLMHRGHRNRIMDARTRGDYLVVGVQHDDFVGKPNLWDTETRLRAVRSLNLADRVIVYESGTDGKVLEELRPDVFIHGIEWLREADRTKALEVAERLRIEVVLLPRTPGVSSSELRAALR